MKNYLVTSRSSAHRARLLLLTLLGLGATCHLVAQGAPADDRGNRRRGGGQDNGGGGNNGQDRRNFDPAAMQERMMAGIRERMGVTNDEEWGLISQRLTKVMELRRTAGGGMGGMMFGGRGGPGGPGGPGGQAPQGGDTRGSRFGRGGSPESEALQTALTDNLPDAEVKARLDRVRDVRKANEAKLAQAQEELRAVLTVRQEAMAVMVGLLP